MFKQFLLKVSTTILLSDLESHSSQTVKELRDKICMLEAKNAQLQADLNVEKNNCSILRKENSKYDEDRIWKEEIDDKKVEARHSKLHDSTHLEAKDDRLSTENLYSPVSDNRKELQCSACCRRATEELERKLNKIRLKYAEIKAQKGALISSEKKLIETLNLKKSRLEQTEEALNRLKMKSRSLLRQYRAKKQMVSSISTKIDAIRSNLLELKDLCKTKDENYKEILSHFGGQIEISARLLANYLNVPINLTGYNVNLKVYPYN